MSTSAKKKELTTLEREAANMNYEDEETDVEVNNEEKYEAMLDARKERRAVSEYLAPNLKLKFLGRMPLRFLREAGERPDAYCLRIATLEYFHKHPQQDGYKRRSG